MIELYLDLISPPCRAVFLFAKAVKIPFEFKLVQLGAGEQYKEEFSKLTQVKKVPVLKDGNFILTESTAILKYMARKHSTSVADHWFPADLQQQARVDEYLSWQHLNLRADCSRVFLLRSLYLLVMGSEVTPEKMDKAITNMQESLDLLEEKFLQEKAFIIGDKISIADVIAVVEVMQPVGTGVDTWESRPKLVAWRERVKKVLGVKQFDEVHESLMKTDEFREKMQNDPEMLKFLPKLKKVFRW
ncbi:glutathione S-transferase theta-1-like [Cynoglossus semilaevis]|uniref:glutathione transferase n=1 Tax=Cynoglossus semilaevis TaxID=244447 RepID=A0A3P8W2I7_CYNSE|nr:glutathione S-transferase theta-1-like [Cynoglossus semilaevis]